MFKFLKTSCFLIFLFSFIFSVFSYDLGQKINSGIIPLPADTQKIDIPSLPFGGAQAFVYTTSLGRGQLISFFKNNLSQKNWSYIPLQEKLKGINLPSPQGLPQTGFKNQNVSIDPQEVLKGMFQFQKGQTQLTLMVMPQKSKDNRTIFSLVAMETDGQAFGQLKNSSGQRNQLQDKSIPTYPESNIIHSGKRSTTLSSKDSPGKILDYYKTIMPGRGWYLKQENPLAEEKIQSSFSDFSDKISQDKLSGEECTSCDKINELERSLSDGIKGKMEEGYTISRGKLTFEDSESNKCMISVSKPNIGLENSFISSPPTSVSIIYYKGIKNIKDLN